MPSFLPAPRGQTAATQPLLCSRARLTGPTWASKQEWCPRPRSEGWHTIKASFERELPLVLRWQGHLSESRRCKGGGGLRGRGLGSPRVAGCGVLEARGEMLLVGGSRGVRDEPGRGKLGCLYFHLKNTKHRPESH